MFFQSQGLMAQAASHVLPFPDDFFHAIVTSPPYWPHRAYSGDQPVDWPEVTFRINPLYPYCVSVPEWTGPFGLEPDPVMFVGHMVLIARELKRVLRPDGNFWLNYGDCFLKHKYGFLEPQSLAMMPSQVALALQADGWMLRNDNVWAKTTGTPEPRVGTRWERHRIKIKSSDVDWKNLADSQDRVTEGPGNIAGGNTGTKGHKPKWKFCPGCDKCDPHGGYILRRGSWRHTRMHEFVFHFTLGVQQWADHTIVQEPTSDTSHGSVKFGSGSKQADLDQNQGPTTLGTKRVLRNPRTVWLLPPSQFKGGHYATYPEDLIKVPMLSSVPRKCCPTCGTGWSPVLERDKVERDIESLRTRHAKRSGRDDGFTVPEGLSDYDNTYVSGYRPICDCPEREPVAGWVLDPFFGSGTTGLVAKKIGVNFVGVDISREYLSNTARVRALGDTPPHALDNLPLFSKRLDDAE
jgi:DNA modification methylase